MDTNILQSKFNTLESQWNDPNLSTVQKINLVAKVLPNYIYTAPKKAAEVLQRVELTAMQHQYTLPHVWLHFKATIQHLSYQYQEAVQTFHQLLQETDSASASYRAEILIDATAPLLNQSLFTDVARKLDEASKILKSHPNENLQIRLYARKAYLLLHQQNYVEAMEYFLESEKMFSVSKQKASLADYYTQALVYSGIGNIHKANLDIEDSIASYTMAINICDAVGITVKLGWHFLHIGNCFMSFSEVDSANEYFRKAIEADDDPSKGASAAAFANLGFLAVNSGELSKANEYLDKAEQIYKKFRTDDYFNLAYLELYRAQCNIAAKQPKKALDHFVTSFDYAKIHGDNRLIANICQQVANFYASRGEYENAFDYLQLYMKLSNRLQEEANRRKIQELEIRYQTEKKKKEAEILRLQALGQQLKALRAQMNPHFVNNALNGIQNFITSNKTGDAAKYLAKFARLMRQSLENSDKEVISLEKEIDFLENYLIINQNLRYKQSVTYQIEVDDDLEEDSIGIPSMIIQPYVENALEHGLRLKDEGRVTIRFKPNPKDDFSIICEVEDDGIGREAVRAMQLKEGYEQDHRSMGTLITEQRLKIFQELSGGKLSVFTNDLFDSAGKASGTKVIITLPVTML